MVKVWDIWVRLFHWLLVIVFSASFISGKAEKFPQHYYLGIVVVSLIVFRLLLGIFGSSNVRFWRFIKSPREALAYIKGKKTYDYEHNPLSGYFIVIILILLLIQFVSGLFLESIDAWYYAPLNPYVLEETVYTLKGVHSYVSDAMIILITIHVIAAIYYQWVAKNPIITTMITGKKKIIPEANEKSTPNLISHGAGLVCFILSVLFGVFIFKIL